MVWEFEVEEAAERAVSAVHKIIWMGDTLTSAQSRLAWLLTIQKLLESASIEAKTAVIAEALTKQP